MQIDLLNISLDDIQTISINSTQDDTTSIMYLQNNGDKNHEWRVEDINKWICEDIDD